MHNPRMSTLSTAEPVDVVVIGAGVVGLAVARALALAGREGWVLESEASIGSGVSARNSEVIHAGIYYPQGSLKARLCVQGKQMLYAYCAERGVAHRRCGKLLVATSLAQMAELAQVQARALANGVDDLQLISAAQATALEPALHCHGALLSSSTGIVDSHGLMLALQGDLENAGSQVVLNTVVDRVALSQTGRHHVWMRDGTCLAARALVNAAGLSATALARRFEGLAAHHVPKEFFAKGNYFSLAGKAPFQRLIYPLPEPGGLGVHLTLDLGGQAKFGPDVQWVDDATDYAVDPARGAAFYAEVRKYWPGLPNDALQAAYAGIRPKISGPGEAAADFCAQGPQTHGVPGLVNLFGIESPGLTSALALGEMVSALLKD
jgi:L-2-hydroxyglutarate oxidase LhgO